MRSKKNILITGGTGGIGKAIAASFLRKGEKVYITGRRDETLIETKKELQILSDDIEVIKGDISSVESCKDIIETFAGREEYLDILINCAGIYYEKKIEDVSPEDWNLMMNTNLRGPFFVTKYAMPYLSKSGGSIVNIGSTAGITGFDADSVYCASKGGLSLMTKALAVECARNNVRINILSPDMVKTDMLDIGFERSKMKSREEYDNLQLSNYPQNKDSSRFITPEDVARAVMFLAYREYSESITGANLIMDFGLTAGIY